jgi:hypothetical protein
VAAPCLTHHFSATRQRLHLVAWTEPALAQVLLQRRVPQTQAPQTERPAAPEPPPQALHNFFDAGRKGQERRGSEAVREGGRVQLRSTVELREGGEVNRRASKQTGRQASGRAGERAYRTHGRGGALVGRHHRLELGSQPHVCALVVLMHGLVSLQHITNTHTHTHTHTHTNTQPARQTDGQTVSQFVLCFVHGGNQSAPSLHARTFCDKPGLEPVAGWGPVWRQTAAEAKQQQGSQAAAGPPRCVIAWMASVTMPSCHRPYHHHYL